MEELGQRRVPADPHPDGKFGPDADSEAALPRIKRAGDDQVIGNGRGSPGGVGLLSLTMNSAVALSIGLGKLARR